MQGQGCSTCKLIEKTKEIINKSRTMYQNVWVVFDRDEFEDFDTAIEEGKKEGFKIAWSNQSFEYWLYLHFDYCDSALHRYDWNNKLDSEFQKYQIHDGKYDKNINNIYELLDGIDGPNRAIKNAKRRMSSYDSKCCKPSEFDPGTTVHYLVEELIKYLNE